MQSLSMLKKMVHAVTNGLQRADQTKDNTELRDNTGKGNGN
jgi:hypothetical protein